MPKLSVAKQLAKKLATKAEAEAATSAPHLLFTTANPLHPTTGVQLKPFDAAKKLQDMGEDVSVVRGIYGTKEPSIFVKNPKNADLIQDMAKAHGQDTVYHSSGGKNFLIRMHDDAKTGAKAGQVVTGSGKTLSSEMPKDLYTKINTKEGPVAYQGALDFDAPAQRGVKHYGPEGLTELDPAKAGKGYDERKLLKYGPDQNKTTQMYNILDPKEPGISGQRYIGSVPESEIYSASKDSKNLITKKMVDAQTAKGASREADAIKGALKEGGVSTFERPVGGNQDVIESFKKVPVVKGIIGSEKPSMNPLPSLSAMWDKLQAPRQYFIDKSVEQMAKTFKQDPNQPEFEAAKSALNFVVPDETMGVGKAGKALGIVGKEAKALKASSTEASSIARQIAEGKKPFGNTTVIDTPTRGVGKVTVIDNTAKGSGTVFTPSKTESMASQIKKRSGFTNEPMIADVAKPTVVPTKVQNTEEADALRKIVKVKAGSGV